jgi:hypothetical protein
MGFSKGILHYMKKKEEETNPFTLNKHVKERLENWEKICNGDESTEIKSKKFHVLWIMI